MKLIFALLLIPVIFTTLLAIETFFARSGPKENFKNPERIIKKIGINEKKLKYMIIGDSTTAGQGAPYEKGIAIMTLNHLAKSYSVEMLNTSISGAVTKGLLDDQVKFIQEFKPDILLISVGGNNVTALTSKTKLQNELEAIIEKSLSINCTMKIVLTASPDMGSPPRLLQPLRWLTGLYANALNKTFFAIIEKYNLTLAPIAEKTGPIFRKDHSLFAADKFHPNEAGYAVWIAVINEALDKALKEQPSHCKK